MGLIRLLVVFVSILAIGHSLPASREDQDNADIRGSVNQPSAQVPPTLSNSYSEHLPGNSSNAKPKQQDSSSDNKNPEANNPTNNNGDSSSEVTEGARTTTVAPQGDCICVPFYQCNSTDDYDGMGLIDVAGQGGPDDYCDSYLKKCCEPQNIISPDKLSTAKPLTKTCGKRNVDGIGIPLPPGRGSESLYGEFPWMMAILQPNATISSNKTGNVYQCGGSLIHPRVVLTGAHCVQGKDKLLVRAGEWDTQANLELYPTQDRGVQDVIIHEEYSNGSLRNDLALLILDSPVDMSVENVGLICLPEQGENMDNRDCVASGWGKDTFGLEGKYQVILKRVELSTVSRELCQEALRDTRLGTHFKLHKSFLCAGGKVGVDTCKGDGGSPLACPSKNNPQMYVQSGIVAWGINCGTSIPGVYVNVPYFVNWITNKLQAQGISLGSSY